MNSRMLKHLRWSDLHIQIISNQTVTMRGRKSKKAEDYDDNTGESLDEMEEPEPLSEDWEEPEPLSEDWEEPEPLFEDWEESHWSLVFCRPCECDPSGTVDHCSPLDGRCLCKTNVEGHSCDRCVYKAVA